MVDRGEHQLHRAPIGAEHQIDAACIPRQRLGKLSTHQEQQHDARGAKAHQHDIHR